MTQTPTTTSLLTRNPGPGGGFHILRACDRVLPEWLFKPMRALGTWVAVVGMCRQRQHSREYLRALWNREPTRREIFRHFFAFEESLMLRLRVSNGAPHCGRLAPGAEAFDDWLQTDRPALLGTFHVGNSDLLGFMMGGTEKRRIYLVRQQVGNSHDTEALGRRVGDYVKFVWINQPEEMLFALKAAAAAGDGAIALQCDRVEHSSRVAAFEFLGARRLFPITIYYLAHIFQLPVLLSIGVPTGDPAVSLLHSSPLFEPLVGESRRETLARSREHFQRFLQQVEAVLRERPYLWFNFLPLNPIADDASTAGRGSL